MDDGTLAEEVRDARREVRQMMRIPPADRGVFDQMSKDELVARLRRAMLTTIALDEEVLAKAKLLEDARRDLRAEKRRTKAMGEKISVLEAEADQATAARTAVDCLLEMGVLTAVQLSDAGWPYGLPDLVEEDVAAIRGRAAVDGMRLYWMTLLIEGSAYDVLGSGAIREHFATPVTVPGVDAGDGDNTVVGWVMTPEPVSPYLLEELWLVPDTQITAPDDSMPVYAQGIMTLPRPMTRTERLQAEVEADLRKPGAMPH